MRGFNGFVKKYFLLILVFFLLMSSELIAQPPSETVGEKVTINYFQRFIKDGGVMTWGILIPLSIYTFGLILQHSWGTRTKKVINQELIRDVNFALKRKDHKTVWRLVSEEETFFSSVLCHGLAELSESHDAAEYAIIEASEEQASRIFSKIEYLNIIGNVSPMIGLIGTVYGIILAFNTLADIVRQGGVSRPDQLAEGISIALVNTFWGLIIAVPALAVYGFLRNRVELLASEAAGLATDLIRSIDPEDAVLYRQFSQKEKGSD